MSFSGSVWKLFPGLLAFLSVSAKGQEALQSYLTVQSAIEPTPHSAENQSRERMHWGPVDFTLGVYSFVKLDDNINLTRDHRQSDIIIGAGVDLGCSWPVTDNSHLRFGSKIGYSRYLEHPGHSALDLSPDSALAWDFSLDEATVTLFDQFSYSRQVINEGAVSGFGSLPRFDNTAGVRSQWQPRQWNLEFSASYSDSFSDSSTFSYLDRTSEYIFGRVGWRFAEHTEAGVESSVSFTDYRLSTQPDNQSYSVGPYAVWQFMQSMEVEIRGGPTFYNFESKSSSAGANNLGSYYLGMDLTYQMTEAIRHIISIQRDVRLGVNEGNKYIEQLTTSYALNWAATRYCTAGLAVFYEHGSQPLQNVFPSTTETFDRVGLNPSVSYRLTEKLSTNLNYWFWNRSSNLGARGYQEQSVTLGLNFVF